jgi:hypothetical protein
MDTTFWVIMGSFMGFILLCTIASIIITRSATRKEKAAKKEYEDQLAQAGFQIERTWDGLANVLYIDDSNKLLNINKINFAGDSAYSEPMKIYRFSDLLGFDVLYDTETTTGSSVSGTVIGGLMFGVVGAALGSQFWKKSQEVYCNLRVRLNVADAQTPEIMIPFARFEKIDEFASVLKSILPAAANGTQTVGSAESQATQTNIT